MTIRLKILGLGIAATQILAPAPLHAATTGVGICERAIAKAEQTYGLMEGLALAIGQVEAGRAAKGVITIWPWAVNVGGNATYYPTREQAEAAVATLLAKGVRNIDVGCMQVNLRWHGAAYDDPLALFDPELNALYGSWHIQELKRKTGSWTGATQSYHAPDERHAERRKGYACRVYDRLADILRQAWRGRPQRGPMPALLTSGERHPWCTE